MGTSDQTAAYGVARLRIRDAVYVWVAALLLSVVVASYVDVSTTTDRERDAERRGEVADADEETDWPEMLASSAVLYGILGGGALVVVRRRGTGSLRRDLGLVVRARDWWAVPAGTGVAIGAGLVLAPLQNLVDDEQEVVELLNDAGGPMLAVLAVSAGLLAPVLEELVFRGLLLRSLLARYTVPVAITASALAFGVVHLLDFSLGSVVALPALVGLGALSAHWAQRTGELSRSILLHLGFNLLAVVAALGT